MLNKISSGAFNIMTPYLILSLFVLLLDLIVIKLGYLQLSLYLSALILVLTVVYFFAMTREAYRILYIGNAPYVRSKKKLIDRILTEVSFPSGAAVYDLGCGDGRFLRALLKKTEIKATGYEYFIMPYLLARLLTLFSRQKIKYYLGDFFKADLSGADFVYCYLLSGEMERLEEKLHRELKPGALVISNTFKFRNWQPIKIISLNKNKKYGLSNFIYFYKKEAE